MTVPLIKGWCPGALRPMVSGDGLVVRVRPMAGRLAREQVLGLCDVADTFGNGTIDLTSRANLQIRGVSDHGAVVDALRALDLVDDDPACEGKRNILVAPVAVTVASGGSYLIKKKMLEDLHGRLVASLEDWPELPNKMGLALDIGAAPVLTDAAADFRFEMAEGSMILRADGCATGCRVTVETAVATLVDLMDWFVASGGLDAGRMARHLTRVELPDQFRRVEPLPNKTVPKPGIYGKHHLVGAAFGQLSTQDLRRIMRCASGLQATPWRMLLLENTHDAGGFTTGADDHLLAMNACIGAPACEQGLQSTRDLARSLAPYLQDKTLHVSGCTKGCACPRTADVVVVGTPDGYDLVRHGKACDTPIRTGLTPEDILEELARPHAL